MSDRRPGSLSRAAALVVDPRGVDYALVARALGPEFSVRRGLDAAVGSGDVAVALVVADHDAAEARFLLAEIARRSPDAARVAVAPPDDADIFGLEAAGAEQVLLRPLLETTLRLAARAGRRLHEARRAFGMAPDGVAAAASAAPAERARLAG